MRTGERKFCYRYCTSSGTCCPLVGVGDERACRTAERELHQHAGRSLVRNDAKQAASPQGSRGCRPGHRSRARLTCRTLPRTSRGWPAMRADRGGFLGDISASTDSMSPPRATQWSWGESASVISGEFFGRRQQPAVTAAMGAVRRDVQMFHLIHHETAGEGSYRGFPATAEVDPLPVLPNASPGR
jgi:hypothetical protein